MNEYLRVARLYMIVLAIFTVGRLLTGTRGVPYEKGHHVFSLVTMTLLAAAFYGAFCRKWRGYGVSQAMALGAVLGLLSQVVILLATVISYALHADTVLRRTPAPSTWRTDAVLRSGRGRPHRRPRGQRDHDRDRGGHRMGHGSNPARPGRGLRPAVARRRAAD